MIFKSELCNENMYFENLFLWKTTLLSASVRDDLKRDSPVLIYITYKNIKRYFYTSVVSPQLFSSQPPKAMYIQFHVKRNDSKMFCFAT